MGPGKCRFYSIENGKNMIVFFVFYAFIIRQ